MLRSKLFLALTVFSVLAIVVQIFAVLIFMSKYQFDFRAYYFAPLLLELGQDPYSRDVVYRTAEEYGLEPQALPFLYPPITIFFFKPLSLLSFPVAYTVWLILQTGALIGILILLVRRFQLPLEIALPVFAFGLNGACAAVLRHGQLTLITLFLLLSALAICRRSAFAAAFLIIIASLPKIWVTPISLFLAIPPKLSRIVAFFGTITVILLAIFSALVWSPDLFAAFRGGNGNLVFNLDPRGPFRGSFVNFIATVEALTPIPFEIRNWIYGAWICLVAAFSVLGLYKLILKDDFEPRTDLLLFAILSLGLCIVSPRMLVYQWGIALPGIAYALLAIQTPVLRLFFGALCLLPTIYISQYGLGINVGDPLTSPWVIPWGFSNIILTTMAWGICVRAAFRA